MTIWVDLARAPVGVRFPPRGRVCYTQRNLAAHSSESMTTTMPHCQMVTPIIRPCSPSSCPSERADHSENVIGFFVGCIGAAIRMFSRLRGLLLSECEEARFVTDSIYHMLTLEREEHPGDLLNVSDSSLPWHSLHIDFCFKNMSFHFFLLSK